MMDMYTSFEMRLRKPLDRRLWWHEKKKKKKSSNRKRFNPSIFQGLQESQEYIYLMLKRTHNSVSEAEEVAFV